MTEKNHLHWGTFQSVVSILRKKVPPQEKVVVRRKLLKDSSGYCIKRDGKFQIRVCRSLEENAAILVLVHEWAHTLAWEKDGSDHSPGWGTCYARCWRALTEEFE